MLFGEKETRKMVYRSRLLEEFVLCAYFMSLLKEKQCFSFIFKQSITYVFKNFVVLMDMIIERASSVYSVHPNFEKLRALISKRKSYFEISSNFVLEKRLAIFSENFKAVQKMVSDRYAMLTEADSSRRRTRSKASSETSSISSAQTSSRTRRKSSWRATSSSSR